MSFSEIFLRPRASRAIGEAKSSPVMFPSDSDTCNVINSDLLFSCFCDRLSTLYKPHFHGFKSRQGQDLDPWLPFINHEQEHGINQQEDVLDQQSYEGHLLGDERQGVTRGGFGIFGSSVVSERVTNKNNPDSSGITAKKIRNPASGRNRDRHSKIRTAQGLRDRRMRLSLEVATDFFGLQDMLGFDKASMTVEWLLIQAKSEIQKLMKNRLQHQASDTLCRIGSEVNCSQNRPEYEVGSEPKGVPSAKEKRIKQPRKNKLIRSAAPKGSRGKARERAKERNEKKTIMKEREDQRYEAVVLSDSEKMLVHNETSGFGDSSWWSLGTGEESGSRSYDNKNNLCDNNCRVMNQGDLRDEDLALMSKWSPPTIFGHHHNNGTLQQHQFTDLLFFGGQTEFYNKQNIS